MSESRLPRAVRDILSTKPMHQECLEDDEIACLACTTAVVEAFDRVYGTLPNEAAVLAAIMDDLAAEEAERSPQA